MSRFRKLSHTIWHCQYHVVWTPKYRYRVLHGPIKKEVENCIRGFSEQKKCEVVELNVQIDHVHLLVMVQPKLSVSDCVGTIKGRTAIRVLSRFPEQLYKNNRLEGADEQSRDCDLDILGARVLSHKGQRSDAITLLRSAYDHAVEQGAWFFALRAATQWVNLEQKEGVSASAALPSLAKAVSSISEGTNPVDVDLARSKLAELDTSK